MYNVSDFFVDHPGGKDIFFEVAGQDATEFFEEALHSEDARSILPRLEMGRVKDHRREEHKESNAILVCGEEVLVPSSSRARPSRVMLSLSVVTLSLWLGIYHHRDLSSLWTMSLSHLFEHDTSLLAVVAGLLSFIGMLGFWASCIINVDYGNLQKFASHIPLNSR